jgi:hypothetical protein
MFFSIRVEAGLRSTLGSQTSRGRFQHHAHQSQLAHGCQVKFANACRTSPVEFDQPLPFQQSECFADRGSTDAQHFAHLGFGQRLSGLQAPTNDLLAKMLGRGCGHGGPRKCNRFCDRHLGVLGFHDPIIVYGRRYTVDWRGEVFSRQLRATPEQPRRMARLVGAASACLRPFINLRPHG